MSAYNCNCNPNNREAGSSCPIIREMRMSVAERQEAYRVVLRKRQAEMEGEKGKDIPHRLQKLGVPYDAINPLARGPLQNRCFEAARRFLEARRDLVRTLVLAGPRGAGKSVAAASVLWDWAKHYDFDSQPSGGRQMAPAVWANAAEVTAVTDFGRVDPAWLEGLRRCQLLILDDLGEDGTAPGVSALADLLKHRHEKLLRTVITSNLPLETPKDQPRVVSMRSRYGDSWFERLKVAAIVPDLSNEKNLRTKGRP